MNAATRHASPWLAAIGWVVLAHWLVVVTIKCMQGRSAEALWLSHLALALTGLSFVMGSARTARAVMIAIAVPHLVWLGDALGLLVWGRSPMLITSYLSAAGPADWLATVHHFYLLPLLWWALRRAGPWALREALGAWLLIAVAVFAGRLVSGPGGNINYAYRVFDTSSNPMLEMLNSFSPPLYLACLLVLAAVLVVLPGSVLVRAISRASPIDAAAHDQASGDHAALGSVRLAGCEPDQVGR